MGVIVFIAIKCIVCNFVINQVHVSFSFIFWLWLGRAPTRVLHSTAMEKKQTSATTSGIAVRLQITLKNHWNVSCYHTQLWSLLTWFDFSLSLEFTIPYVTFLSGHMNWPPAPCDGRTCMGPSCLSPWPFGGEQREGVDPAGSVAYHRLT